MTAIPETLTPDVLRDHLVGADACIETPYGARRLLYADYTASGRALDFVEAGIGRLLPLYANTHTEDDTTGRTMTRLLHEAETRIKQRVNAGPGGRVIGVGSGATGAIQKMQQIVGVALPPATRASLDALLDHHFGLDVARSFRDYCRERQPVVFVGPYEHHSNEVTWRESLATVIEVELDADGGIDLGHLERLLADPRYRDRVRIGSFSAASNVTGMRTPVAEIAALLHRHDAFAFFDYAASAPYTAIDMNPAPPADGGDASIDAVFISPHKFAGGPGASGILVFNERCYRGHLPPTVAGGGTVDFVGPRDHDFVRDIEAREKAGTPGILQVLRAALAFEVKHAVGEAAIEARESGYVERAFERWRRHRNIEILGNPDPHRRIGIVSFNIRDGDRHLHPRFVTALLDDLFGVQSRAGCSCAGPYGHRLLGIDDDTATRYRRQIAEGWEGIKPGWCRVGLHYALDEDEFTHLVECIEFVADHGRAFLGDYRFDLAGGAWRHADAAAGGPSLDDLLAGTLESPAPAMSREARRDYYRQVMDEANRLARKRVGRASARVRLPGELGELQYYSLVEANLAEGVAAQAVG